MKHKEEWPVRSIRIPDELWFKLVEESGKRKLAIAELIRLIIKKELE